MTPVLPQVEYLRQGNNKPTTNKGTILQKIKGLFQTPKTDGI